MSIGSEVQAVRLTVSSQGCFYGYASHEETSKHSTVVAINIDDGFEKHTVPEPI